MRVVLNIIKYLTIFILSIYLILIGFFIYSFVCIFLDQVVFDFLDYKFVVFRDPLIDQNGFNFGEVFVQAFFTNPFIIPFSFFCTYLSLLKNKILISFIKGIVAFLLLFLSLVLYLFIFFRDKVNFSSLEYESLVLSILFHFSVYLVVWFHFKLYGKIKCKLG